MGSKTVGIHERYDKIILVLMEQYGYPSKTDVVEKSIELFNDYKQGKFSLIQNENHELAKLYDIKKELQIKLHKLDNIFDTLGSLSNSKLIDSDILNQEISDDNTEQP